MKKPWTEDNLRFVSKHNEVVLHFIFGQDLSDEITIGEDLGKVLRLCKDECTFTKMVIKNIQFLVFIA